MNRSIDLGKFKHSYRLKVRNYEVDWQGIVHNANYLLYFETARMEYFKNIGFSIDIKDIVGKNKIVLVRNEIDYLNSATLEDELEIFTRMIFIRKSSFALEGFIKRASGGLDIGANIAYHVWLDPISNKSKIIDTGFRKIIKDFEGLDCDILDFDSL